MGKLTQSLCAAESLVKKSQVIIGLNLDFQGARSEMVDFLC